MLNRPFPSNEALRRAVADWRRGLATGSAEWAMRIDHAIAATSVQSTRPVMTETEAAELVDAIRNGRLDDDPKLYAWLLALLPDDAGQRP